MFNIAIRMMSLILITGGASAARGYVPDEPINLPIQRVKSSAKPESLAAKPRQARPECATTIPAAHVAQSGQYMLTGDSKGVVTLRNVKMNAMLHTFQMDPDIQVREVFLLDKGATIGASQVDHVVFWDAATGKQLGRINERAYGFTHDQTKFFTQSPTDGSVNLYSYPALHKIGQISAGSHYSGPNAFLFSPDDQYLVVQFDTTRPETDSDYPYGSKFAFRCITTQSMFDIQAVQEMTTFSKYHSVETIGTFSADSKFYDLTGVLVLMRSQDYPANFQFDLATGQINKRP